MNRLRLTALATVGVPAALLLLLVLAWAVDSFGGAKVPRNVTVAGRDVGGLDETQLRASLDELSAQIGTTPVNIVTPRGPLASTAADLGLDLDEPATASAALDVGRGGAVVLRPLRWLGSFFGHTDAPTSFAVDQAKVATTVTALEAAVATTAVEPEVAFQDGILVVEPGSPGEGLDPAQVATALARVDEAPKGALTVDVDFVPVDPRFSNEEAQVFVGRVNAATAGPIQVDVGGTAQSLDGTALRPFVGATPGDAGLAVTLEPQGTLDLLASTFADAATAPQDATASVSGGQVVVSGGSAGTVCCEPSAVAALTQVIEGGPQPAILQLTVQEPARGADYFAELGITQVVSSFTTNYPCCLARVTNIHRMSDMVTGTVVAPGEIFSLNAVTGRRTLAKGFLSAGVILDATFAEDVGGGVSQYSTTLFNAAFFGGLDFYEYMAHGQYISRYPYGREATLSFPSPDLKFKNITPYGILIWSTYSDTSITVELYSTPFVSGQQTGQTVEQYGEACKLVTTQRTITWLTGETATDTVSAVYQDADGVRCDGSRQEPETTTTTTDPNAPPTTAPVVPNAPTTTAAAPPTTAAAAG